MARAGRNVSTQACHAAPDAGGLAQQPKEDSRHALSLQSPGRPQHSTLPALGLCLSFIFTHHPTPEREPDSSPFIVIALGIAAQPTRTPTHTPPPILISVPS